MAIYWFIKDDLLSLCAKTHDSITSPREFEDESDDMGSDRVPRPESNESDKKPKGKGKSRRNGNKADDGSQDIATPTESVGL